MVAKHEALGRGIPPVNSDYAIPDGAELDVPYAAYERMERPADGFDTPEAWEKLNNLIASHKTLIMKSIGADNLEFHEEVEANGKPVVAFYWLPKGTSHDLFMATLELITYLCRKALELRRVDPTEHPVEDEQFIFSRFLHRIGMVGTTYKKQRKILMQNLGGSTWKKAVEARKVRKAEVQLDSMHLAVGCGTAPFQSPETFECVIHSLDGKLDEAEIIGSLDDQRYLARYKGIICSAIYNVFTGRFYVDDKYGVQPDSIVELLKA
jgi:hypothetical protein